MTAAPTCRKVLTKTVTIKLACIDQNTAEISTGLHLTNFAETSHLLKLAVVHICFRGQKRSTNEMQETNSGSTSVGRHEQERERVFVD